VGARVVIFGWSGSVHVQRWVTGLQARGFEMKVVSLGGPPLADCETTVLPRTGRWSYLTHAARAAEAARAFAPDLVHAHYATGFGYWAVRSRLRPSLVSVWGADVIDFPAGWFRARLLRAVLRRATHLSATSQFLRSKVIGLDGSLASQTSVIPFGVAIPAEAAAPPPAPPVRLCYVKNLRPKYGADVLLQAMARARKELPDLRLDIAGEGEMKARLLEKTKNLGLDDLVEFVGFVPNDRVYAFIREHHIMVMPSVCLESFGVAALEAAACGRPVIASAVGGVPEVVRREETGILVPPGDSEKLAEAIVRLGRDAALRERFGRNGWAFAKENYNWELSLDRMSELYLRLIDEKKKS